MKNAPLFFALVFLKTHYSYC